MSRLFLLQKHKLVSSLFVGLEQIRVLISSIHQ